MTQRNLINITVKCPRCGKEWTYPLDEKEPLPSPEEICPTCVYDSVNEANVVKLGE